MSFFRRKSKTKTTAFEADNNGSAHRSRSQDRNSKGPVSKASIVVNVPQQDGELCVVQHSYVAKEPGHISLLIGRIVQVTEKRDNGLWKGTVQGEEGWFPATCVRLIDGVIAQAPARAPDVVTSTHRRSNPNVDLPDLQQVAPSDDDDIHKSDEDRRPSSNDDTMDHADEVFVNADGKRNGGHRDSHMMSTPLSGSSARTNEKLYIAMYPFEPSRPDQMQLDRNELVYVIEESDPPGWIKARKKYDGVEGWVPKTYVRECASPVKDHERVLSSPDDPDSDHEFDGNFDDRFVTVFSYEPQHDGDLGFSEGEVVAVMEMLDNGWWKGRIGDDRTGWFPGSYVQPMSPVEKGDLDTYMPASGNSLSRQAANFIYQNVGPNANKGPSLDAQMPVEARSPGPADVKVPSIYQNIFPPNAPAGDGNIGNRPTANDFKPGNADTPTNRPIADRQPPASSSRPDYLPPEPPVISVLPPSGVVSQRPPAARRGLLITNPADIKSGGRKDEKSKKSDDASDSESGKHAPDADKKTRRLSLPKLFPTLRGKKKEKADEKHNRDSRKGSMAGAESMTSLHSTESRHDESHVAKSDILNISAPIIAAGVVPRYASVRHGSESRSQQGQATPEKPTALKAEVPTVPAVVNAGGSPKKTLQKTVSAEIPFNGRTSFTNFARQSSVGVSSFIPDVDVPIEQQEDKAVTQPFEKRATLQRSQSLERRGSDAVASSAASTADVGDNQLDVESVDYLATMGRRPKKPKLPPPKPPQRMNSMLSSKNVSIDPEAKASNADSVAHNDPQVDVIASTDDAVAMLESNTELSLPPINHDFADSQPTIKDSAMEVTLPNVAVATDNDHNDLDIGVAAEFADIADAEVGNSTVSAEPDSGTSSSGGFSFKDELRLQAQRISIQRQQSNVDIDTQLDLGAKHRQHLEHTEHVAEDIKEPTDLPVPLEDIPAEHSVGFSVDDVLFMDDATLVNEQVQEIFSICTMEEDHDDLADIKPLSSAVLDDTTTAQLTNHNQGYNMPADTNGGKAGSAEPEDHFEDAVEPNEPPMTNDMAVEPTPSKCDSAVEKLTPNEVIVVEPVSSKSIAIMSTSIDDPVDVTLPKANWVKEQRQKLNSQSVLEEVAAVDTKKAKKGHKGEKKEKKKKETVAMAPSVAEVNAVTTTSITQADRLSATVTCDVNDLPTENLYINVNDRKPLDQNGVADILHTNPNMQPEPSKIAVASAETDLEVSALASSPTARRKKRFETVDARKEVHVDTLASSPTSPTKKVEAVEDIRGDTSVLISSPASCHKKKVDVAEPVSEDISTLTCSPTSHRKKIEPATEEIKEVGTLAASPITRRKVRVEVAEDTKEEVNTMVSSPAVRRKKKSNKTDEETGEKKKTKKKKKTKNLLSCSSESVFSTDSLDIEAVPVSNEPTTEPEPVSESVNEIVNEPMSEPVNEIVNEPVSEPVYTTHTDVSTDDIDVKDTPEVGIVKKKKKKKKRVVEIEQTEVEQPAVVDIVPAEPEVPVESNVQVQVESSVNPLSGDGVVAMEGSPTTVRKKVRKTKKGTGTKKPKSSKKAKGQLYASSESIDSIDDYLTAESDAEILDSAPQNKSVDDPSVSMEKELGVSSPASVGTLNGADVENRTNEPEVSLPSVEVRSANVIDSRSVQIDDLSSEPYSRASKRSHRVPEVIKESHSVPVAGKDVEVKVLTPAVEQFSASTSQPSDSVPEVNEKTSILIEAAVEKVADDEPIVETSHSSHIDGTNSLSSKSITDSVSAAEKVSMSVPLVEKTSISKTERASISETEKASNTTAAVLPENVVTHVPVPHITNKTEAISPPRGQGSVMKAAKMFEEASGFTSTRKLSSTSTDETFAGVTEAVDRVSATVVVDKPTPIVVGRMSSEERTSVTSPTRLTFPNTSSDIASSTAVPSKTPASLPVPVNAANVSSPVNVVNTSVIPVSTVASTSIGKPTSSEPVPVVAAPNSSSRKPSSRSSRTSEVLVVADLPSPSTVPTASVTIPSNTTAGPDRSVPVIDTIGSSSRKPSSRLSTGSEVPTAVPTANVTSPSSSTTIGVDRPGSVKSPSKSDLDRSVPAVETAPVTSSRKSSSRMSTGSEVLDALSAAVAPMSHVTAASLVSSSADTKHTAPGPGIVMPTIVKTSPTVRFKLPHASAQSGHDASTKLPHYVHDKVKRFDAGASASSHTQPVASSRTGAVHVLDTVRRFQGDSAAPTRPHFMLDKHSEPTRKVEDVRQHNVVIPEARVVKPEPDVTAVSANEASISPKFLPKTEMHAAAGSPKLKPVTLPKPTGWKPASEPVSQMPVIVTRKSESSPPSSTHPTTTTAVKPEATSPKATGQIDSTSMGAKAFWPERQTKLIGVSSTQAKKGLPPPAPKSHKQTVSAPSAVAVKDLTSESDEVGSEEDTRKIAKKSPSKVASTPRNVTPSVTESQLHTQRTPLETDLDAVIAPKPEHEPTPVMSNSLVKLLAPKGFKSRFAGSTSNADQPPATVDKANYSVAGYSDSEDLPPPPKLYTSSLTIMTGGRADHIQPDTKQQPTKKQASASQKSTPQPPTVTTTAVAADDDDYYTPPPRPLVPAHLAREYNSVLASPGTDNNRVSLSSNSSTPSPAQSKTPITPASPKVSPVGNVNSSHTQKVSTSSPAAVVDAISARAIPAPANMRRISYWTEETDSDDQTTDDDDGANTNIGQRGGNSKVVQAEQEKDSDEEEINATLVPHGTEGDSASDDYNELPPPLPETSPPPLVPCLNDYYKINPQQRHTPVQDDDDVFDGRVTDLGEGATDF